MIINIKKTFSFLVVIVMLVAGESYDFLGLKKKPTPPPPITTTSLPTKGGATSTATLTPTVTLTASVTATVTNTVIASVTGTNTVTVTVTATPTSTLPSTITVTSGATTTPYINAPDCLNHSGSEWHGLWNGNEGCFYDHEHGDNVFIDEYQNQFPADFNFKELQGGVEVGHTNPSSPAENHDGHGGKHGGMKIHGMLSNPHGCIGGFEGAQWCVMSSITQYHNFGNYDIEMETAIHSTTFLGKICNPANPTDCGYLYTPQFQQYGQRVSPYQGYVLPYPNSFQPPYLDSRGGGGFGQYFTIDCVGVITGCRPTLEFIRTRNLNVNSIWTSKITGTTNLSSRPQGSTIFNLLFRVRDIYQVVRRDTSVLTYPFDFEWVCSSDNGTTYNGSLTGCRWNNTTSAVHEVAGVIPANWDNLSGFDTDPRIGRITATGFTTRFGELNLTCITPSVDQTPADGYQDDCFPIKMKNMFVGKYGDYLTEFKVSNPDIVSNPERDIYFCGTVVCSETSTGARPSGKVGANN